MGRIHNNFFLLIVMLITVFISNGCYASKTGGNSADISIQAKSFALFNANMVVEQAKKSKDEKQFIEFLKKEVPNVIAIKYMALWVLGNNRNKFTQEQVYQFITIFQDHLTEFYGAILYQSRNNVFKFNYSKSTGNNSAVVEFIVPLDKQKVYLDWQIRKSPKENKLLITDFVVNGISFLQAKRTEYSALFHKANNNPEKFLKLSAKEIPLKQI